MITPLDIENKEFSKAMRGYNAEEVDAFLAKLPLQKYKQLEALLLPHTAYKLVHWESGPVHVPTIKDGQAHLPKIYASSTGAEWHGVRNNRQFLSKALGSQNCW